ncbi:pseudoazurin [Pseudahrensia aquimaris]|uniref:Pseudoazurin n=1 Tax=Pseudahrensia aquimaris TaxID=744461 RepID=A0ABW3FCI7_9HYPH
MRKAILIAAMMATALNAGWANAAEFEVLMLNKGEKGGMVFEPDFVKAAPGDTLKFVPTDKGHNVESIKGMLPDGVEKFKSKFNVEYVLTVDKEGLYGIKCSPHYGMGMIALIAVGTPTNEADAKAVKQRGKAKKRFEEAFAQYEASK